jgi:lipoate-protein ligase A
MYLTIEEFQRSPTAENHQAVVHAERAVVDAANLVQCYISKSSDPYLNLAIEDHILCTSPDFSTICFLYVNRPCLVMGRNQNPWLEPDTRLCLLYASRASKTKRRLQRRQRRSSSVLFQSYRQRQ